jgi:hypothetical protein
MSTIAATAQAADRVDYWVRRHVFHYCYEAHPCPTENKRKPAWDRRLVLSAIGQCLKDQYDVLATPVPPRLAVLIRQLEAQK